MMLRAFLRHLPYLMLLCTHTVIAADSIQVRGLFRDTAIVSINGKQKVLKKGRPTAEGIELIRANSRTAVIRINGKEKELTLGSHIDATYQENNDERKTVIGPDSRGMYFVNGSINGFQVKFLVDTGATLISMNRNEAKRMGINYKTEGVEGRSQTASGISKIYLLPLDKVRVGDIELRDVQASVHDSDHPAMILLGNSFLSQVDIERKGKLLTLTR